MHRANWTTTIKQSMIVSLSVALLSSCGTTPETRSAEPIKIQKAEPTVQWKRLNTAESLKESMDSANLDAAATRWHFGIVPEFGFEIVEKGKKDNFQLVKVKITSVHLKISLPIKVLLSDKAEKVVEEHEKGHVEICKKYYEKAESEARRAAESVLGKTFEGMAPDEKAAMSQALITAGNEVGSSYNRLVAVVNMVSEQYDKVMLKSQNKKPIKQAIEEAISAVQAGPESKTNKPQSAASK